MEYHCQKKNIILYELIRKTELAFFIEYFLPLAGRCMERSKKWAEQQETIGTKTYEVLTYQVHIILHTFLQSTVKSL